MQSVILIQFMFKETFLMKEIAGAPAISEAVDKVINFLRR